jgi:hypothetical protein
MTTNGKNVEGSDYGLIKRTLPEETAKRPPKKTSARIFKVPAKI